MIVAGWIDGFRALAASPSSVGAALLALALITLVFGCIAYWLRRKDSVSGHRVYWD